MECRMTEGTFLISRDFDTYSQLASTYLYYKMKNYACPLAISFPQTMPLR